MLPAGEITEKTVEQLGGLLEPDDIIIDGGNSFYKDDIRAYAEGFDILRNKDSKDLPEDERFVLNIPDIAEVWRRGSVISSWLLDLGAAALVKDPQLKDFSGYVQDSGEGRSLDVTHPQANKGTVVETLSRLLNIPPAQIATMGDMPNDVLMFRKSGFSIAMGNASDEVKAQASAVTDSNENEGFAKAVRKFVL